MRRIIGIVLTWLCVLGLQGQTVPDSVAFQQFLAYFPEDGPDSLAFFPGDTLRLPEVPRALVERWVYKPVVATIQQQTQLQNILRTTWVNDPYRPMGQRPLPWSEIKFYTVGIKKVQGYIVVYLLDHLMRGEYMVDFSYLLRLKYTTNGKLIDFTIHDSGAAGDGISHNMYCNLDSVDQFISTLIGGGGGLFICAGCSERIIERRYRLYNSSFTAFNEINTSITGFFLDSLNHEALYIGYTCLPLPETYCCSYRARYRNNDEQDTSKWQHLQLLSLNQSTSTATVQFPGSPTTYTLTLSPDGHSLSSRGSDGSPVQTFYRRPDDW